MGYIVVVMHYLRFLYFYRQENPDGMNCALLLFKDAVQSSMYLDTYTVSTNYYFLSKAKSFIYNRTVLRTVNEI